MKIGLIGFGKTGKAVASVLLRNPQTNLIWVLRLTAKQEHRRVAEILEVSTKNKSKVFSLQHIGVDILLDQHPVDIIIDFSTELGVYSYGEAAAQRNIKIISAISHYDAPTLLFLEKLSLQTVVFWSPNITVGVNYLIFAAKFLKKIAPFVDIEIVEEHFKQKKGVSGTAIKIAEALGVKNKKINSVRAGGIVGKHQVIFGFKYQTVRLIHESISREAFGNGVIFVAINIRDKKTGFYDYEAILTPFLEKSKDDN